ncbi:protoporphyrinogen oxidase [Paenibacillus sp. IHBB 10380]|uniref:protoporphyrinogen oxidase n=1 Tax=Paenibacillus sp. IHBB 10380 TaxID=1566358 RepID=UPI0005CFA181|nr:protoporphyrinogen oxidase [Paenibacillus sp. IHBB 10380]AJS59455.1 protoporphyrinogen oxidase [Paenibacillus sp. IHBB 10380]
MIGTSPKIVIIGGGITGLSAAFYVRKFYREAGIEPRITILEKGLSMGGKIDTLHRDGFIIERGPDSFLARKTAMTDLSNELGLEAELVTTNPEANKTYILHHNKLHPMPSGLVLGIPTEIVPFLKSGLISFGGKVRALMDFVIPPRRSTEDESVGDFIARRLGPEALENVAEPLLAAIYAGETGNLSLQATFPQFGEVEREYGSLIRGMMSGKKPLMADTRTANSTILTYRNGLQSLVTALAEQLDDVEQLLNTGASALIVKESLEAGSRYIVQLDNGQAIEADDVIITTPNDVTAELLRPHLDVVALDAVNYVSVANVVMAFSKSEVTGLFDGSEFLVPRKEGRNITSCTWTSTKWLHTSPDDKVLLGCYVGRAGDEQNVELPDDALKELVLKDLKEIVGISAKPIFTEITRLMHSMPQYPIGHLQAIETLRHHLFSSLPGVYLTGAGYEGVGLPDCIKQAKELAMRLVTSES